MLERRARSSVAQGVELGELVVELMVELLAHSSKCIVSGCCSGMSPAHLHSTRMHVQALVASVLLACCSAKLGVQWGEVPPPAKDSSNVEKVNIATICRSSRGKLGRKCRVSTFRHTLKHSQVDKIFHSSILWHHS